MDGVNVESIYKFCPSCGHQAFRVRQPNLVVCDGCGFHYHINPVVAAAAFIMDRAGDILLIRRAKEPAKGKLAIPGGFIDINETAETGLIREVREEVDLQIDELTYLASFPNQYRYKDITYPVLDLFFTATVPDFSKARAQAEVQHLLSMPAEKVPLDEIAFPSIVAAFKHLLAKRRSG